MQVQRIFSRVDDGTLSIPLPASFNHHRVEVIVLTLDEDEPTPARCQPHPDIAGKVRINGDILSLEPQESDAAPLDLAAENRELWRRLRLLRDEIRLVDWHHMQYEHPEIGDWFKD